MSSRIFWAVGLCAALVLAILALSCTREHENPLDPVNAEPFNLRVENLVGRVRLRWVIPDVEGLEATSVFRRDWSADTSSFALLVRVPLPESTYVDTAVIPGTRYDYQVAAYARGQTSRRSDTVTGHPRGVDPPYGLVVKDVPGDQGTCLIVEWQLAPMDTVGGEVAGYVVTRDTILEGPYVPVDTVGSRVRTTTDCGLTPGVLYYYRVHAVVRSLWSDPAGPYSARPIDDIPPRPPAHVTASDRPDDQGTAIVVSWSPSPDDGAGANDVRAYEVYRGSASDSLAMIRVTTAPSGTRTIVDEGLQVGSLYYYRVRARDSRNLSPFSPADSARAIDNGVPTPPAPPSNLRAINPVPDGGGRIQLLWQKSPDDGGAGIDGYRVYRRVADGTYGEPLVSLPPGTTEYLDATVTDLVPYFYQTSAYRGTLESARSNEAGPVVSDDEMPPARITTLSAAPGQVEGEAVLSWIAPGDNGMEGAASMYFVKYAPDSITTEAAWNAATAITVGVPTPLPAGTFQQMTARGLPTSGAVWFCVRATDDRNNVSPFSNPASTSVQTDVTPPGYVDDLIATLEGALEGQVVLTWTATGDDGDVGTASRYDIRASLVPITSLQQFEQSIPCLNPPPPKPAGQPERYVVSGLTPQTKYYFRLRVFDEAGNGSPMSAQVSEFAQVDVTPPAAVTDLAAFGDAPGLVEGQILLRWTATSDDADTGSAASAYQLKYRIGHPIGPNDWNNPSCVTVPVPFAPAQPGQPESLVVGSLAQDLWHFFALRVVDERGNTSPVSNSPQALPQVDVTRPARVTDLAATRNAPGIVEGQIQLTWTAVGDDSLTGTVSGYQFRYQPGFPITDGNWAGASVLGPTNILRGPRLAPPGQPDTLVAKNLTPGAVLYFACKAFDDRNNYSLASNSPRDTVQVDVTPPAGVTTLQAITGPTEGTLKAKWVAVGDDSLSGGPATAYDLRYRTSGPITTEAAWQAATQVTGEPTPSAPGQIDSMLITNLQPDVVYYIALKVVDDRGNWSRLSNSPGAASGPDVTPPPDVLTFTVQSDDRKLHLRWTPPSSPDYKGVLIGRRMSHPVNTNPVPRVDYAVGDPLPDGASIVVYIGSGVQWSDTSVVNDSTYHYRAYSYDLAWNYSEGKQASGTPADTTRPNPVTNFTARQVDGGIRLRWTNPSTTDLVGVMVRFDTTTFPTTPTSGTLLGIGPGTPSTADSMLHAAPPERRYYYAAFAMDEVPNYSVARHDSATYDVTPPGPVTGLVIVPGNTADTLSWQNPPTPDLTGIMVLRRANEPVTDLPQQGMNYAGASSIGTSTIVALLGPGQTSLVDTGLTNGVTYHYAIIPFDWRFNYAPPATGSATPGP